MKLRAIRLEKGLSVPALSRLSNVPVRTIEDIEKRGDCKVSTAILLADALEVSLDPLRCRHREGPLMRSFSFFLHGITITQKYVPFVSNFFISFYPTAKKTFLLSCRRLPCYTAHPDTPTALHPLHY